MFSVLVFNKARVVLIYMSVLM